MYYSMLKSMHLEGEKNKELTSIRQQQLRNIHKKKKKKSINWRMHNAVRTNFVE